MNAFWEPWQPKEGDLVRVRLSGECQRACRCTTCGTELGHVAEEDGATGQVAYVLDAPIPRVPFETWGLFGHRYDVELNKQIVSRCPTCVDDVAPWSIGIYAAAELEPLEASS